jgi:hypothetical protein
MDAVTRTVQTKRKRTFVLCQLRERGRFIVSDVDRYVIIMKSLDSVFSILRYSSVNPVIICQTRRYVASRKACALDT